MNEGRAGACGVLLHATKLIISVERDALLLPVVSSIHDSVVDAVSLCWASWGENVEEGQVANESSL